MIVAVVHADRTDVVDNLFVYARGSGMQIKTLQLTDFYGMNRIVSFCGIDL